MEKLQRDLMIAYAFSVDISDTKKVGISKVVLDADTKKVKLIRGVSPTDKLFYELWTAGTRVPVTIRINNRVEDELQKTKWPIGRIIHFSNASPVEFNPGMNIDASENNVLLESLEFSYEYCGMIMDPEI